MRTIGCCKTSKCLRISLAYCWLHGSVIFLHGCPTYCIIKCCGWFCYVFLLNFSVTLSLQFFRLLVGKKLHNVHPICHKTIRIHHGPQELRQVYFLPNPHRYITSANTFACHSTSTGFWYDYFPPSEMRLLVPQKIKEILKLPATGVNATCIKHCYLSRSVTGFSSHTLCYLRNFFGLVLL